VNLDDTTTPNTLRQRAALLGACFVLALTPVLAQASSAHGETLDAVANALAIFILIALPIGGIVLFWLVHILPEKFAEKRHHPQKDAIKTLCLLSLVFGGMLWPIAWLWAFTKPTLHKLAYGTDKHEDYYREQAEGEGPQTEKLANELEQMRQELGQFSQRGARPDELAAMGDRLGEIEARLLASGTEHKG
jgi:CBS domain containing-hemolysin-like protein